MSILIFTRILRRAALPAVAIAVGAATARAQSLRLDPMPNARRPTVFVPPKTVVRIKDRAVFVKGDSRSLTVYVSSPTALSDTARLATEAKAVIAAEISVINQMGVTGLAVAFESPDREITVQGVTPGRPTSVSFLRDSSGKWQPRKIPPRKIELNVVPGRP